MKPPASDGPVLDVPLNEWIKGQIDDIKYDLNHEFKNFETGEIKVKPGCKIVMKLKIKETPELKDTPWLTFSYDDRSNLYSKFLANLVDGAKPYMDDFDLDNLQGLYIKIMYTQKPNNKWPSIVNVVPLKDKVKYTPAPVGAEPAEPDESPIDEANEEIPF